MRRMSQLASKVVLLIAIAMLSTRVSNGQNPPKGLWEGNFPNVTLKTQDNDNKGVRVYEDLIKGKTVVINFMYTTCDSDL